MIRRSLRLGVLASASLGGCYTYQYLPEAPRPGTRIAVDLTDVGRSELADNVGPDILQVEGRLTQVADSQITLAVTRTVALRGLAQDWAGEAVTLRTGQYRMVRERTFSAPRTVVLAGAVTAGFVAFVAGVGLTGGASGDAGGPNGGGGGGTQTN